MRMEPVGFMMAMTIALGVGFVLPSAIAIVLWLFTDKMAGIWPFGRCLLCKFY